MSYFKTPIFNAVDYISLTEPINLGSYIIVGYFPYERAKIRHESLDDTVNVPREVFRQIEDTLHRNSISANKQVIVCRDLNQSNHFAIFFHDKTATIGRYNHITDYLGHPLKSKLIF